MLCVD